jgi:broad specificity phosphatase PhoE
MPGVFLVRHGATAWNKETPGPEKIRAWEDIPLAPLGIKEAERLGKALKDVPIHRLYTSDLQRAEYTAKEIAQQHRPKLDVIPDPNLRPWHLGSLQGQVIDDKVLKMMKNFETERADVPVPGGESFNDFVQRYLQSLRGFLWEAITTKKDIMAVVHTRDIRVAEGWVAAGAKGDKLVMSYVTRSTEVSPGGVVKIEINPETNKLTFTESPRY